MFCPYSGVTGGNPLFFLNARLANTNPVAISLDKPKPKVFINFVNPIKLEKAGLTFMTSITYSRKRVD
jgi:hypothetical protein